MLKSRFLGPGPADCASAQQQQHYLLVSQIRRGSFEVIQFKKSTHAKTTKRKTTYLRFGKVFFAASWNWEWFCG